MKKIFCFILFGLLLIAINCTFCSCDKDEIYINGNVEETLEIYNDFNDPGVSFPNSCTLVIEGNIDNTTLGRQHIIYYVYAESGELLKELHRYVNVVDSTAPTYLENETADSISFYIGKTYTISDFIVEYEDNYDSKNNISVSCTEFIFDKMGDVQIDIVFTDKAGNTSSFSKVITVVADTTPPSFVESADINNQEFYVGMRYDVDCFIADYYDNYASKEEIMVAPSYITFEETGTQPVNIEFTDTFGNKSTYSKTVIVKPIDFALLIQEAYKDQSNKVTTGTNGIGSSYTRVRIDTNTSLCVYDSGSIHYLKSVETSLGKYASVQISAKYGEFNNANVSFHISGLTSKYSVGFATIDATSTTVYIANFDNTINDLNLDESEMLEELNNCINEIVQCFRVYMNDTFNVELK